MGRHGIRQLCAFVLACGVYGGAMPQMYLLRLRGSGAGDFGAFAFEAVVSWLLLAAAYVYWRQLTPLAVHVACVALGWVLMLRNPDVIAGGTQFALVTLGDCAWAATLISFPVSLALLALAAIAGHPVDPLTTRLASDAVGRAGSRPDPPLRPTR